MVSCQVCESYPSGESVACPQLMDESLACLLGLKLHAESDVSITVGIDKYLLPKHGGNHWAS